jgi:hypothetical protein
MKDLDEKTLRRCEAIRTLFNRKLDALNRDDPASSRAVADFYWQNFLPLNALVEHYKKQKKMPEDIARIRRIAQFENQLMMEEKREMTINDERIPENAIVNVIKEPGDAVVTKGNPDGQIDLIERD